MLRVNGQCVSFVGGYCLNHTLDCVQNSVCVKTEPDEDSFPICVCEDGYERTKGNICQVIHLDVYGDPDPVYYMDIPDDLSADYTHDDYPVPSSASFPPAFFISFMFGMHLYYIYLSSKLEL